MSDLNKIIGGAKAIEKILTEQFGGTGRGMTEKLKSARYPIPEPLQKRIKHLAWLRNRSVHEEGFHLDDADDYAAKCERVCEELRRAHAIAVQVAAERAVRGRRLLRGLLAAGVVLAAAWWFLGRSPAPPADEAAPASASAAVSASATAAAAAAPVAEGEHLAIGNDVLAIDVVGFRYAKDSWDRLAPEITVQVRNTSDRTLSSAHLHARLYLNGEARPALDTSTGGFMDALFVSFGEQGLAPGATVRQRIYMGSARQWDMPDALNARSRTLVLRVASVLDGRKQEIGATAAPWPVMRGGAAPQTQAHARAESAAALRAQLAGGAHVAATGSAFEAEAVQLALVKDSWGREVPRIRFQITNRSGVTVSHVGLHARVLIHGERSPVLDTETAGLSGELLALFPAQGLGNDRTAEVVITPSGQGWDTPDLLNAVRAQRAQLVLRLTGYTDGRAQRHALDAVRL